MRLCVSATFINAMICHFSHARFTFHNGLKSIMKKDSCFYAVAYSREMYFGYFSPYLLMKCRGNSGTCKSELSCRIDFSFQPLVPCFACRNLSMSWLHPSDLTSRENEREAIEINWFLRETFARKLTTMINHWTSEQRLQSEHCFAACSKLINEKRGLEFGLWQRNCWVISSWRNFSAYEENSKQNCWRLGSVSFQT